MESNCSNESVDVAEILEGMNSPDEAVRARAARSVCPCRLGWGPFEQCLPHVSALTKDPSPLVRKAALHVFEDAFEMESMGMPTNPREARNEMLATRRRHRWRTEEEPGDQRTHRGGRART